MLPSGLLSPRRPLCCHAPSVVIDVLSTVLPRPLPCLPRLHGDDGGGGVGMTERGNGDNSGRNALRRNFPDAVFQSPAVRRGVGPRRLAEWLKYPLSTVSMVGESNLETLILALTGYFLDPTPTFGGLWRTTSGEFRQGFGERHWGSFPDAVIPAPPPLSSPRRRGSRGSVNVLRSNHCGSEAFAFERFCL